MTNSRQKILYIITKSNFGGAQRYVYELATNLSKDAFEVVVAAGGDGLLHEKLHEAGIRTRSIKNSVRDIHTTKDVRSLYEQWKIIGEEAPDIIHLNSTKAGASGSLIARLLGIDRIIFSAHGWPFFEDRNIFWRFGLWFFSWLTALLSHKVILVSNHDGAHAHMPFTKNKLSVIHTSVPNIDFLPKDDARNFLYGDEEIQRHASDIWLVTTAELTRNKNVFFAVDAVLDRNRSHERKIFYSIIGDGELRVGLEEYIRKQGGDSHIRLLGYVGEARRYLKAYDMFLLPSLKEGMPYALLEAGAAGLYSIASNVGGIPEIIEHGKTGILIDPRDKRTLTSAFESYLENSDMGKKLQEKVASDFSLQEMLEKTFSLYRA